MSVEFYVCKNCGSTFPDCGEYISCEQCFTHWCSDECAEEDGYNKEHCAAHEELDDGDLMDMYRENTVITSVAAIVIIMFQIVANIVEKKILRTMFYWSMLWNC